MQMRNRSASEPQGVQNQVYLPIGGGEEEDDQSDDDGQSGSWWHDSVHEETDTAPLHRNQSLVFGWSQTCRTKRTESVHTESSESSMMSQKAEPHL